MLLLRAGAALGILLFGSNALAQSTTLPIFQYAIFYNGLLEFTWCPPMTINGRVQANGNIYTGTAWKLIFNDYVTATGSVSSPAWDGHSPSEYAVPATFNRALVTNAAPLFLFTGTSNSFDAMREIINMPPPGGDTNTDVAAQRFYNKAGVVLLVSNTSITAIIKNSMNDLSPLATNITYTPSGRNLSNYINISNYFPFINLTNLWPAATNPLPIIDQRENKTLLLTDINVSKLNRWLFTNSLVNTKFPNVAGVYPNNTNAPNIMYVADNRTYTSGQLTAIRLNYGTTIPTNLFVLNGSNIPSGFTFATPNPLYVQGHYNVPDAHYYSGTNATNTAASGAYPASLISDALTILSTSWVDSQGTREADGLPGRNNATSTTISAAILTGFVPSTGSGSSTYSGGVHNLPRLLENWSTAQPTLTLNTSFVTLYNSARATNVFINPPAYYDAPIRNFNFDPNFLFTWKLPPGTPGVAPALPSFVAFPANQTVALSGTATFSTSVVGLGILGFQWAFATTISGPFLNIPNATNASLVVSDVGTTNVGYYQITVTNASGSISYPAPLTLAKAPKITNPPGDQIVPAGATASFAVTATGTGPLSYQWELNGTNILGATQAALSLTNVSEADAGEYMVIVTNVAGAVSNSAGLSIALPPVIDPPLSNLMILAGQSATFNATASGTGPLTYQWSFNGTNALSATDAILGLNNVTPDQAGIYTVVVTNIAGATSNSATLSVYASAAATLSALPSFSGGQFQFTVSGVPGFSYVIEASTNFLDWDPLVTNASPFTLSDDGTTNFPIRFYRAIYAP